MQATDPLADDDQASDDEEHDMEDGMPLDQITQRLEELFGHFPAEIGKTVSRKEREVENYHSPTLVYGEIHVEAFVALLNNTRQFGAMDVSGGKFVDIGSGAGKAVFAAALVHDWDHCVGIEINGHASEREGAERTRVGTC